MYRTVSALIRPNDELLKMMEDSRCIYDYALYIQRQEYFNSRKAEKIKTFNYNELWNIVKNSKPYIESKLDVGPKTYAIKQVCIAWSNFIKAIISYKKDSSKFTGKPKMPNYLYKRTKYNIVDIDSSRFRIRHCKDNEIRVPNGNYIFKFPKWLKRSDIKQIKLQYFYGKIKVSFVYEDKKYIDNIVDKDSAIGIDLGVNNICAITSNDKNFSCIIKGGPIKSINQYYNKKKANLQSSIAKCNKNQYTSKKLINLSNKRNNKINYYMHCISKSIIDLCIANKIEKIIIGHNNGWKQNICMSKKNTQNFIQIPFNILIEQIKYKAEKYLNLNVTVVEESYTSKCDHLAFESMQHHNEYLGKRIKRGIFVSSTNKLLNADINGAIGILRKGKAITDAQILCLCNRGDGVSPSVLKI